jgi:hypothetical protein
LPAGPEPRPAASSSRSPSGPCSAAWPRRACSRASACAAPGTPTERRSPTAAGIGTVDGTTWSLSGASRDGRPPQIQRLADTLRITTRDDGPFDLAGSGDWTVILPRATAIGLDLKVNGGQSRLAFDGSHLDDLSIDANAGSIDLDLRGASAVGDIALDVNFGSATLRLPNLSLRVDLSVNAGSAAICLPSGAGLRVRMDSVAASNDFAAHGLVEANGTWQTPGYDAAPVRIDLQADVNAGSLALDPMRTCSG